MNATKWGFALVGAVLLGAAAGYGWAIRGARRASATQIAAAPTQPAKIDRDSAQVTHGPGARTIRATQDAPPASIGRIGISLLVRPAPLKRQYAI